MTDEHECPIPATHDKYEEAKYFLSRVVEHYHHPWEFQFNLNAFIQAYRNITFMLQSEPVKPKGFAPWYGQKQEEMRANPLLRNLVEARNVVVKKSSLTAKSGAQSGLFRNYTMKLAIVHDIPVFMPTTEALERAKEHSIGLFVDEAHSAIGEQIGVERIWIVEEIGESEVVSHCLEATNYMGYLIEEVHTLAGIAAEHKEISIPMERIQVLLETDVDPSLPEKWGW
ncbi:MAG: hypothetical protein IH988_03185 [Planctomycetes bacterium]|nr:hypothetical protein [Planctomycetota bacterium]